MKKLFLLIIIFSATANMSLATETDSLLIGKWNLFKIIENLTGNEIIPPQPNEDFKFYIDFQDSIVKFNLEINKCENSYEITGLHQIKFLYYDECTKICCDKDFSKLLIYEQSTNYYIINRVTLVLTTEERIFYFSKAKDE